MTDGASYRGSTPFGPSISFGRFGTSGEADTASCRPGSSPELIDLGLVEMRDDVQVIACLTSNHRVPNGDQASRAAALAMKRGESGDFTGQ
jgi:hypothetical protein